MPDATARHRPRPRKVPKQARSIGTVRFIVEAAARVLERGGLGGFSTNAVAERAGVSVGSLYQYFPSKEALIGALIVRETSQLIEEAEAAKGQLTGAEALSALIRAAVAHQFRRPALARLLDFEEARLPFDADTRQVADRFGTVVLDLLRRPDLPSQPDVEAAARDIVAIIKGMVDAAGANREADPAATLARVQRAVFGYLDAPE